MFSFLNPIRRASFAAPILVATCLTSLPVAAQECEVKIGAVGTMTGAASAWGLAVKAGAEFQAAVVNAEGGLPMGNRKCKVKVVSFDETCSAAGGAAASNMLASEGVVAVMGPQCSPATTGWRPVAKRNGQVAFSTSYMKDVMIPEFPLVFHALQGPAVFGPILIKEARKVFKFNSVVVFGPNDQGGTDTGKQVIKMYEDVGVKATGEYYQRGTTNFAPLAARVIAMNAEALDYGATPPADVSSMTKALLEAGYKGIFGGLGGIGLTPMLNGAGSVDKVKGYYYLELMPVDDPGARKLRVDFERLMKIPAPENALFFIASTATEQLLQGVSLAGTDRDGEKIADALRKMKPESRYFGAGGWRGRAQYGINQELAFPIGMGVIADGKNLGVTRVEIPTEK
jgi:branched-chain amino acid transport system substrate-binding protein